MEPSHADDAIQNFNGMALGDQHLRVQRASIGMEQASSLEMGVNAMSLLAGTTSAELEQGRVLQLLNMVTPDELMDNDEYEGKSNCLLTRISSYKKKAMLIVLPFDSLQKFAKMSRKSAASTAKCLKSKCHVPVVEGKFQALARSLSNLINQNQHRQRSRHWQVENLPTEPLSLRFLERYVNQISNLLVAFAGFADELLLYLGILRRQCMVAM